MQRRFQSWHSWQSAPALACRANAKEPSRSAKLLRKAALGLVLGVASAAHADQASAPDLVTLATTSTPENGEAHKASPAAPVSKSLDIMMSLSWEGRHLTPENLAALDELRKKYPQLKFVHFISPAYFSRNGGAAAKAAAETIKARIAAHDAVGIHLSGWRSAVTQAGVVFRGNPTFWGNVLRPVDCEEDCGLEVPIHVYPDQDVEKLVSHARSVLKEHSLPEPIAAQAAGWVASPHILTSFAKAGIKQDHSAVAPAVVAARLRHYPLMTWIREIWESIPQRAQPYTLPTRAGSIIEVPQHLAAIDYVGAEAVIQEAEELIELSTPKSAPLLQMAFYQETASANFAATTKALDGLLALAKERNVSLDWVTEPKTSAASPPETSMPLVH